ncbi:DUF1266 domain-containing protein [Streptococcus ruminantium]|uniref:DUF1266 domain-containing protein n=1 Tax=Streptococcus ruminantium TaxID=1917441 RepID=UPI0012DE4A1F|nr:DUF1266 domain-containing protein [Streptococcus ruminantium]
MKNHFRGTVSPWTIRKVNKWLAFLGSLSGFIIATIALYLFAIWGYANNRLVLLALLPLTGTVWFSIFDKKQSRSSSSDDYWDFGKAEKKKSKFDKVDPSIDWFGAVVSIVFAYLSIYLSEVLVLVHAYQKAGWQNGFFSLFTGIFTNILRMDEASKYLWKHWIGLTIVLMVVIVGLSFHYIYMRMNVTPGRKLTDAEKAKLAYGAVLFTRNGLSYDYLLGYLPTGRIKAKEAKEMLARDWDIHNKNDVLQIVNDLLDKNSIIGDLDQLLQNIRDGQADVEDQAIYDDIISNLMAHYQYTDKELEKVQTLGAWNSDRLVNLVRYAYAARYISEKEMWDMVDQAIIYAKHRYGTWREYFAAVILGRSLGWGGDFESNRIVAMKLLNNPNSIYKQYPF